jgi:hypothetical protein
MAGSGRAERLAVWCGRVVKSAPADFGYPWVDDAGKVVVNVATQQGASRFTDWHPSAAAAKATRGQRGVTVSSARFEQIRDDIAAQVTKHAPGFDHIIMVAPEGANNRLILSVNSIDDPSLATLASRYGTELVAIRYEPGRERMHVSRYNDSSGGTGFWGGSAVQGTAGRAGQHPSQRALRPAIRRTGVTATGIG